MQKRSKNELEKILLQRQNSFY